MLNYFFQSFTCTVWCSETQNRNGLNRTIIFDNLPSTKNMHLPVLKLQSSTCLLEIYLEKNSEIPKVFLNLLCAQQTRWSFRSCKYLGENKKTCSNYTNGSTWLKKSFSHLNFGWIDKFQILFALKDVLRRKWVRRVFTCRIEHLTSWKEMYVKQEVSSFFF